MELKRLGDYVKIQTGKLDANASSENGKYPFFTCSVNNLWIDNYAYDCECVLIAGNGDLNVKYYEGKFNAYQRTYVVESIDKTILDIRYLYYFMNKYIDVLRNNAIGGVIKYIKMGDLTEVIIPLPPLKTQKKIVEVLDKAQGLIDVRKEQIRLIDELIQSVFYEMFGDPVTNSKGWEVCKMASLGSFKNGMNFISSDSGVTLNCLGVGDFKSLYKINQTEVLPRVSLNQIPSEGYMLKNKDIVFVRSNGNKALVGRSVIVYPNDNKTTFSGFCIRLRVESTVVHEEFLIHLLRSNSVKQKLLSNGRGANISNLNQKMLSDIDIVLPPKELQMKFYKIVEKIEIQKSNMELSLAEHTMSFQSLMKKFFQY